VCLYSPGAERWAMTERAARHVQRGARDFVIGPSAVTWDDEGLTIEIDERTAPWPRRVLGRVRLRAEGLCAFTAALDAAGRHRWGPIAPCARIEVDLRAPDLRWTGEAYFDTNEGDEPITQGFEHWQWQRATLRDGSCRVHYDARDAAGNDHSLMLAFDRQGQARPAAKASRHALDATRWWRLPRACRSERAPTLRRTLEDTPFYTRSLLDLTLEGERVHAVHETLDARRLASPIVQALLPVRMPRRR
jgi:carotenoid 1,2-hydratase